MVPRWQELDADNKVTTKVWDGKQDIYHLLHCLGDPAYPVSARHGSSGCSGSAGY